MNGTALTLMVVVQATVLCITGYFFYRVLTTPPKAEPDSFSENDEQQR
ncbi:MAG: hypothetical protein H6591_10725 [Flavobacteriales bacterium]|nr:hypothetical protein [Flavobacteriales bacterium]